VLSNLWQDLISTGPLEAVAVVLGVVYVLLIMKRNRLGWLAGGISSIIYVYIAAHAGLPMQATLQVYYVVMAVYGWWSWSPAQQADSGGGIGRWPWRIHLTVLLSIALLTLASARVLASETHAAWPYLDSFTTWLSLVATWMTTRLKLENWLYWMGADLITSWLFAVQGHPTAALLFVIYLVIAVFGFREWLQQYRLRVRSLRAA
jgi:nicotinamide mononucleotide transporter